MFQWFESFAREDTPGPAIGPTNAVPAATQLDMVSTERRPPSSQYSGPVRGF